METSCKNLVKENQDWKADGELQQITIRMHTTTGDDDDEEPLKITELPDSIFLHIFGYLSFSDIGRVAQVCHRWSQISVDDLLWKEIFLRHYKLPLETKIPAKAQSWGSEFKRLYYHTPCLLSEERKEHRDEVLHVSFSHDGTMFATCSKDGFFKVWECGQPCCLLFEKDMMSSFSWKFTQFSQFNETDTCLLVSGVYFGSFSTAGEIAVFNLQDDFHMQCRVTNKPYDVFGAWYDNDHLLSGTLYWTGDTNSISAVWLSKASQEVESEMESVSMVLYRFENHNSSSIRLLHVAQVEREDEDNGYERSRMEHSLSPAAIADSKSFDQSVLKPVSHSDLSWPAAAAGPIHGNEADRRMSLLDKLLKKSIAENEFDLENEDDSEDEGEQGKHASDSSEPSERNNLLFDVVDYNNSNTLGLGEYDYCEENPMFSDEDYEIQHSIFGELKNSSNLELRTSSWRVSGNCEGGACSTKQFGMEDNEIEVDKALVCDLNNLSEKVNSFVSNKDLLQSNNNCSDKDLEKLHYNNNPCAKGSIDYCDIDNDDVGKQRSNHNEKMCSELVKDYEQFAQNDPTQIKYFPRSDLEINNPLSFEDNSNMDTSDAMDSQQDLCVISQNVPHFQGDAINSYNNLNEQDVFSTELCKLTGSVATQTEESASLAGSIHSMAHMSHSSSLSREVARSSTEKLLIYTWGSETYIPHKIGIKRINRSDFCKGEVKARQSSMLLPDVMENLHNMSEDRRDVPDISIDMHGHIVGLSLSPDQRYLYVNCRAWPRNYIISDPQESPPLAQEVEISTIDLTTFQFVGPVLRSHKAYTHSDECFFLNLDVSDDYVVSGAENRKGYIWDRHYGICLGQFDHRSVVNSMAICPSDPEIAVSVSDDHTYKVWMSRSKMKEAERTGKLVNQLTHRNSFVTCDFD